MSLANSLGAVPKKPSTVAGPEPQQIDLEEAIAATKPKAEKPRAGARRAIGKSRDPEFRKLTVYVRKATLQNTELRILHDGHRQELSEVVEELLSDWTASRPDGGTSRRL